MNITFPQFLERVESIRGRISDACRQAGRDPSSVKLMAVTKTHPLEAASFAARAGLPCVGENRVQEAIDKIEKADFTIPWELIGHLQTNKAKGAAQAFARIQTVDRIKLVGVLDRYAGEAGRILPILLQVNAGDDPAKFGATVAEAPALLEAALAAPHLRVEGLMTIAPLDDSPDVARAAFARLRLLRDNLAGSFGVALPELSMGMTGDLAEAVAEGSTLVRVGTALFGSRD
jgi:PLP dependent protein